MEVSLECVTKLAQNGSKDKYMYIYDISTIHVFGTIHFPCTHTGLVVTPWKLQKNINIKQSNTLCNVLHRKYILGLTFHYGKFHPLDPGTKIKIQ